MNNNLQVITQTLKSAATLNRTAMALGLDAGDEKGKSEARKYAASVLAEVEKSAGDSKKDLTGCNPHSIAQAMIDAARFKIAIDGKQHAHLVKYGNNATLQIGYRAYLAKIKEYHPDADFVVTPVYRDDELKIWEEDGVQKYTLNRKNPFADGEDGLQGVLFSVTYTEGDRVVRKVTPVPKGRIDRARRAAKQDFIWKSDYIEKAKAAAIKNACKHFFASLQGVQDMAMYDNEANFDVSKRDEPPASALLDNLNSEIMQEPERETESDVIDIEHDDVVVV